MNRSHQLVQDEDLSVSDDEEHQYGKDGVEEKEGPLQDDSYTDEQFTTGVVEGMSFRYVQTAFAFYKEHSRLTGFGVVKKSGKKLAGQIKYVTFGYDKYRKTTARNQSKKVDCKARELSRTLKKSLVAHNIAGLRPSKSIRLLEVKARGLERMTYTPRTGVITFFSNGGSEYFLAMLSRYTDSFWKCSPRMKFFYSIDSDNTWRLRNVVWVHTHCKASYRDFNDVICFDTTYLVNQWCMSFASFIGVNHHNQYIFLGCALLTSEDIETYAFVFRTWFTAMGKIPSIVILIDQCESIKAVIHKVLPNTVHRYCIWYIFTKLPVKLRGVTNYKRVKAHFKAIIFDSITIAEFGDKWHAFVAEYDLGR
ncbi:hypothetical protein P3S68_002038 [Capsicum galapagoense]